jgi:hypothetical protein
MVWRQVTNMEKTPEQLYEERTRRVEDAIHLRVPDRVPFFLFSGYLPCRYASMTLREAHQDSVRYFAACKKLTVDLAPDLYFNAGSPVKTAGSVLNALDMKQVKWPGHGVPADSPFQFVEAEYVKADEVEALLEDPSDFAVRTYLPRVYGALESFRMLPPLSWTLLGYITTGLVTAAAIPAVAKTLEVLITAGQQAAEWAAAEETLDRELAAMGFPVLAGSGTFAPLDFVGVIRSSRGLMLDLYRQPDKLLALEEKLLPITIDTALALAKMSGNQRVFMSANRGADGLMSPDHFKSFYWPGFKKVVLALVEAGLTPCVHLQGSFDTRLEYLTELPRGKIVALIDQTDIFRAKEILGNTMCIAGNMPLTLLRAGTPEEIKAYAKKLIDLVGRDGGFIMTSNTVLDDADPERVRAWIEFTKQYGIYE